jgi:hypothetical protein
MYHQLRRIIRVKPFLVQTNYFPALQTAVKIASGEKHASDPPPDPRSRARWTKTLILAQRLHLEGKSVPEALTEVLEGYRSCEVGARNAQRH